ncbi:hypothetical protein DIS24_g7110 [Lasiodiplodia hormozganensis]|uniref:Uncharacterized protein n=1 Tax=Lasiodiplodia hormozganensis TaxID=869390 RepID=A0AA39YCR2_9PEZI|nr:hypothetical protein DIS24_g7110 [Lasiodiplodia hormozganensis]
MSSKTHDPSRGPVALVSSPQNQWHISLKIFLVGLGALVATFFLLVGSRIPYKPKSRFDLIIEEIAPSVTRADLKEATDAVNEILNQLMAELKAHPSGISTYQLKGPKEECRPAKRQLLPDLFAGLFGGDNKEGDGEGNATDGAVAGTNDDSNSGSSLLSGLFGSGQGEDGGTISTLAKPLVNALGNMVAEGVSGNGPLGGILGSITTALASGANALGAGVGEGAIKGLKLENMTKIQTVSNAQSSGISSIARNLGEGASEAIFSNLDLDKLMPSSATLALAASALGSGLGNGSASGLKLSQNISGPDSTQTGIAGLAGNLGFGLTDGLFSNIDTASFMGSSANQGFMKTLSQIPGPAGRGLGKGAAIGLKLVNSSSNSTDSSNDTFDVSTASESFTRELASSFLGNTNLQQVDQQQLLETLAQVAPAIGQGLGRGAAAGLKQCCASAASSSSSPASPTAPADGPGTKRQVDPPPSASESLDLQGIAGNFSQNLAQSFIGNVDVSQLGGAEAQKQLLETLSQAAPFAGSGLGQGAAEGLGLTGSTSADRKRTTKRQDSGQDDDDSSIDDIAQGFTRSLSSSFFSNANFSALVSKAVGQGSDMIGSAVQGLAQGLGGGAATGLGLQKDVQEPIDSQDIGSVLKGFSRSLTTSFLANGTLQNIQDKVGSFDSFPVIPVVQGLAKGFGNGAASALGLQEAAVLDPSATDIPTVAQGFSESLTQSFLSNGTTQKLTSLLGDQGSTMLGSIAEGLGKGFGSGAAESLGLQSATAESNASDAPAIAQGFSRALTTSFLANGTLDKITQQAMDVGGGLTDNIDLSKVAEGLGIGLIDGGSMVIFMQTGAGDASLTEDSQRFNDTVGGAATGFGRGLSSEAVKAIFIALGNEDVASNLAGTLGAGTDLFNTPSAASPSAAPTTTSKRSISISSRAVKRQAQQQLNTTTIATALAQTLNLTTVNALLQDGANALGCTGVGGLIQVGLGLQQNLLDGQTPNLPQNALSNLPNQTINITSPSSSHLFQLTLPTLSLTINGLPLIKLAALLAAHVFAVALAFYLLLPAALALDAARALAVLLHRPDRLRFAGRTATVLQTLVVPAFAAAGAALGAVAVGSAAHGRTPHQVVGWVTVGAAVVAGGLHFAAGRMAEQGGSEGEGEEGQQEEEKRKREKKRRLVGRASAVAAQLVLALAQVELVLGFQDLNEISFCATQGVPLPLAVAAGAVLTGVVFVSVGAVGLRVVAGRWERGRKRREGTTDREREEEGREKVEEERPPLVSRFSN